MAALYFEAPREERYHVKTVVSDAGGVTIPKIIRRRLGLVPRTVLAMWDDGGRLVAVKEQPGDVMPQRIGKGLLPNGLTVEEYIESLCG